MQPKAVQFRTPVAPDMACLHQTGMLDMAKMGLVDRNAGQDNRTIVGTALPQMTVSAIPAGSYQSIESAWRVLQASALDDAPFMSPDFLLPAACHLPMGDGPDLIAIWEETGDQRQLVGLIPIAPSVATMGDVWTRPRKALLWRHVLQPFAAPLLAGPHERATRTIEVFLDWLETQPGLSSFSTCELPSTSSTAQLLAEIAERRRLPLLRKRGPGLTRGLDFKPKGLQAAADSVTISMELAELRASLERLLCLDGAGSLDQPIVLEDPMQPALLRAVVRSFGRTGRALIAEASESQAGALFLVGRDQAYLWRTFGRGAANAMAEAALVVAAERRLGLPIAAASTRPLCGAGTDDVPTETLVLGLVPELSTMVSRLRLWIG